MQYQIITSIDTVSEFVFPSLIALLTTIASYIATKKIKQSELKSIKEESRQDFIETLNIDLNILVEKLDDLSKDPQIFPYFSIKKIDEILGYRYPINSKVDQGVSTLSNKKIRKDIRDILNETFSTVDDINQLERFPLSQAQNYQQIEKETFQEFRRIKLVLINQGIFINEEGKAEFLDSNDKDKRKLEQIDKIISDLPIEWKREKQSKEQTEKQTNSQRSLLVSQLIKSINNIKKLIDDLNATQEN